jgi:hypothetical protein
VGRRETSLCGIIVSDDVLFVDGFLSQEMIDFCSGGGRETDGSKDSSGSDAGDTDLQIQLRWMAAVKPLWQLRSCSADRLMALDWTFWTLDIG